MKETSGFADMVYSFCPVVKTVNALNNLIERDMESYNPSDSVTGMQGVIFHFVFSRNTGVYSKGIGDEFRMRRRAVICPYLNRTV